MTGDEIGDEICRGVALGVVSALGLVALSILTMAIYLFT